MFELHLRNWWNTPNLGRGPFAVATCRVSAIERLASPGRCTGFHRIGQSAVLLPRVASRIIEAAPWLSLGDLPEDYATFIRMYSPH